MCVGKAAHVCGFSVLVTVWAAPLPPTQDNKEDEHSHGHDLTNVHCALIGVIRNMIFNIIDVTCTNIVVL